MSTTIFNKLALALPIQIRYNYQQIKMINYLFFCLMKTGGLVSSLIPLTSRGLHMCTSVYENGHKDYPGFPV